MNNTSADFLYSRLAALSALQSYAATSGYYMTTDVQQLRAAQTSAIATLNQQVAAFHEQYPQVNFSATKDF